MDQLYLQKLAFKMAMVLLIIGGINWLFVGLFNTNVVTAIFGKGLISRSIFIIVGLCAIAIMMDRDTYLPFLGPMVAPCSAIQDRTPPGATKDVVVHVEPYAKVLYWAAEPATEHLEKVGNWKKAYQDYENAGVASANADGMCILKVREPQPYSVPFKGTLKPHVHFRICSPKGWMGRIKTVFLEDSRIEGFEGF